MNERIPEGFYNTCWIKEAALIESANKGTPGMEIVFAIDDDRFGRVERTTTLWLSDGAMKYSVEKLERLGFNGDYGNPEFSNEGPFSLKCQHEAYTKDDGTQGLSEKWNIARGGGGSMGKRVEGKADLITKLNRSYRASAGDATPPKPPAPATPPSPAAPSAPPPQSGAAPTIQKATSIDEAWAICVNEIKDEVARREHWAEKIAAVGEETGRHETDFTPDDWNEVAVKIQVPF